MLDFLLQQQADILLLQEVYNGQSDALEKKFRTFDVLKESLCFEYGLFAPAFIEVEGEHTFDQGNAVLSKYPLQEVSTTWYDMPYGERIDHWEHYSVTPRSLQHHITTVENTQLHLFNTQGIWGEDGEDNERRLAMAEQIIAEVDELHPLVLAGDFNVRYQTHTIAKLEEKLTNVFKHDVTTTFNLRRKDLEKFPGFADAAVDGVFVTPDIKVTSKFVPDVYVSDHLPMVVKIEVGMTSTMCG